MGRLRSSDRETQGLVFCCPVHQRQILIWTLSLLMSWAGLPACDLDLLICKK